MLHGMQSPSLYDTDTTSARQRNAQYSELQPTIKTVPVKDRLMAFHPHIPTCNYPPHQILGRGISGLEQKGCHISWSRPFYCCLVSGGVTESVVLVVLQQNVVSSVWVGEKHPRSWLLPLFDTDQLLA